MRLNDRAVSIDLTDAYLHVPIHHLSRKYLRFVYQNQVFSLHGLTVRNVPKSVYIFKTDGRYSSVLTPTCHISLSIPRRLADQRSDSQPFDLPNKILHTNYSKSRFPAKLKKSDLFPPQKFTFIGMEFLTQQNLVSVPTDRVQNLLLTIKKFLSFKQVSARTFLSLLGKLSATADFVLLGRLHLRPLQMCLFCQPGDLIFFLLIIQLRSTV